MTDRPLPVRVREAARAAGLENEALFHPDTGLVSIPVDDFIALCWRSYTSQASKDVGWSTMTGAERLAALRKTRKDIARRRHLPESQVRAEEMAESLGVPYNQIRGQLLELAGDFSKRTR